MEIEKQNMELQKSILEKIKELHPGMNEVATKLKISILMRKALNYMNRTDFPKQLVEPFAEVLALEEIEVGEEPIKSIKEGDTTYEFGVNKAAEEKSFLSLKSQLNKFRRVGTL